MQFFFVISLKGRVECTLKLKQLRYKSTSSPKNDKKKLQGNIGVIAFIGIIVIYT